MDKDRVGKIDYNPESYKTKLCTSFSNEGYCRFGDACNFAHGESERAQQFLKLAHRCDPSLKKQTIQTVSNDSTLQVKVIQLENQVSSLLTEIEKKDIQISYLESILHKIVLEIPSEYKIKPEINETIKSPKSQSFASVVSSIDDS